MRDGLTVVLRPRVAKTDQRLFDQRIDLRRSQTTTWIDPALLILSLSLLSLSVLYAPLVSPYYLAIVVAVAAVALYTISVANGGAVERISQRRLALFLVVVLNLYLVSLTNERSAHRFLGLRLIHLATILGMAVVLVWVIRIVRLRAFTLVSSPIDLAVLLLFLLTAAGLLGLYGLLRLNGLTARLNLDLFWVVLWATVLYCVLRDVLATEAAVKRGLQLALIPLAVVGLGGAISLSLIQWSWHVR